MGQRETRRGSSAKRGGDPGAAAVSYAVRLLGYRDRSEAELRERLAAKGFGEDVLESAIGRLKESGFVDDRRLAGTLVRHAVEVRCLGAAGVRTLLIRRGLPREIVEQALSLVEEAPSRAERLVRRRLEGMSGLPSGTVTRRLWAFLSRRGFSPETIREALKLSGVKEER